MELTAAIEGLSALKQPGTTVEVISDSRYLVQGATEWMPDWIARGWKTSGKKPVANRELWQRLKGLMSQHDVTFTWVPREQNTEADSLAQSARLNHSNHASTGTPDETQPTPASEFHLLIAGSRYATRPMLDYARRVVRRAHRKGYTILVGDNPKGVDMAVINECRRLKAKVIVAGAGNRPRNGGCWHGSYVKVAADMYSGTGGSRLNRWTVRDRWLVDNAQMGVFIWDGDSPGTKAGFDYMQSRSKEAHLVNFDEGHSS